MIVTLSPNPSIDRTIELSEPLDRGGVIRSVTSRDQAGGKGVNVAQVVRKAGQLAVAVIPGDHDDPLLSRLRELGVTHRAVPTGVASQVNLTLAEPTASPPRSTRRAWTPAGTPTWSTRSTARGCASRSTPRASRCAKPWTAPPTGST